MYLLHKVLFAILLFSI